MIKQHMLFNNKKTFNKVSESPALNLSALGDYVRDFDEHFNDKMNNLNNI